MGKDILGKSRAVKTIRRISSKYVGNAQVLVRGVDQFIPKGITAAKVFIFRYGLVIDLDSLCFLSDWGIILG